MLGYRAWPTARIRNTASEADKFLGAWVVKGIGGGQV